MRRGTRDIGGRYYDLFSAHDYFVPEFDDEAVEREAAAARRRYEYVRVIKDRRRYRAYVYVFGLREEQQ